MADTYNVFISWSGERSKGVAAALREWLPMVVQTAEPWMSEEDIEKGSRGLDDIGKALAAMGVGIICLTPENLERPWILFEAGALSKSLGDKTRVCPYLFGDLRPENVKPPLGMFQATKAVKDDTRKLVGTVNRVLGGSLGEEKLDTVFERMWPELEKRLHAVPKAAAAAAPQRSEREMLAELLELSRVAAANFGWSRDGLVTLLRHTNRFSGQAGRTGEVGRFWGEGFDSRTTLSERIEAGKRALAGADEAPRRTYRTGQVLPEFEDLEHVLAEKRAMAEGEAAIETLAHLLREHPELQQELGAANKKKPDDEKK